MPITELQTIEDTWRAAWPAALACWSRFVQLSEPRWCLTIEQEKAEHLSGSFAMIRLNDHAVVISLKQIQERGLGKFAVEVLAHEIGHHVYCPADLSDNARMLARMRVGLPTKENLAPMVANLYGDLLINDRLQRGNNLDLAGVYLALGSDSKARLWTFYMRMYELLWGMDRASLAKGEIDRRLDYDAQLGARLIRSYAKDWLDGAGRFACLCLPYLLADDAEKSQKIIAGWSDTLGAGAGGAPDGLAEYDPDELAGAIHPSNDPDLSGVDVEDGEKTAAQSGVGTGQAKGETGQKTMKQYRQPFEYTEVLKASGSTLTEKEMVMRYYRELAMPHLIPFPSRLVLDAVDPQPEGLDLWDVGEALSDVDWLNTVIASPVIIPGVTTRQRTYGTSPGTSPESLPIDLYLGVDCSGSMGNPAQRLSFPVLGGAIIALSALRSGSRVMVALSGEPGKTITTEGFVRDENIVLSTLTDYLGTGMTFGIHRLAETFAARKGTVAERPVHILIVTDSDIFGMLDSTVKNAVGWDIAKDSVSKARGGGSYVLQIPAYHRTQTAFSSTITKAETRMAADGWDTHNVETMEDLVEFARKFSRANYGQESEEKV